MKFLILFSLLAVSITAWQVTLYEHPNHRGRGIHLKGVGCVNLPSDWHDIASAINTHGLCVVVHSETNCQGDSRSIKPSTGCHSNLAEGNCGMDDHIRSLGPCWSRFRR